MLASVRVVPSDLAHDSGRITPAVMREVPQVGSETLLRVHARVADGRSKCWWLRAPRNGVVLDDLVFDSVQGIAGTLISMRVPPLCLVVHAFTVGRSRVRAGLQLWAKFPRAMRCYRLPLPERALFA